MNSKERQEQSAEVRTAIFRLCDRFSRRGFPDLVIDIALLVATIANAERRGENGPALLRMMADSIEEGKYRDDPTPFTLQ